MDPQPTRVSALDQLRGLAIVLMVPANYLADVAWIPPELKHAPDVGLTAIDVVAPMFLFAVGLTYRSSFLRRAERDGTAAAYRHFATRWLALIGIGAVLAAGEVATGKPASSWGVLQAIGASGLAAMPLVALRARWRLGAGVAILAAYQLALDLSWRDLVLHSAHGGLAGVPGWTAMLLLSTAVWDLFQASGGRRLAWASLASLAAGGAVAWLVPVSKNRVSASYVLITLGISIALFGLCVALEEPLERLLPQLATWGRNALALYVLHLVLIGVFVLPGVEWWHVAAPGWLVAVQLLTLFITLDAIAGGLRRRGWYLAL